MIKVSNIELVDIIKNKSLIVEETYQVIDYPTFPIFITPLSKSEINPSCKTDTDGLIVYYDYTTHSIYRMIDNIRRIDMPFDYMSLNVIDDISTDITINELVGNKIVFFIKNSYNINIDRINSTGTLEITDCNNINIGKDITGVILSSNNIEVGDNNTNINLLTCKGITIGSDNDVIQLEKNEGIDVGNKNINLIINKESTGNIIGSSNKYIELKGKNNKINCDCLNVVSGDYSTVDSSSHVSLTNSLFNKIERSNAVELSDSVGNEITIGSIINLNKTNNNKIYTTALDLTNKNAFVKTTSIKNIKTVEDIGINKMERSDSQGTTLNTKLNLKPSVDISKNSYYIKDNIWVGVENLNENIVSLHVLPNPKSDYTSVSGAGEYRVGTQCRLQATPYKDNKYFSAWILCDEDGKEIDILSTANPYIFTIQEDMYVYAQIKENN